MSILIIGDSNTFGYQPGGGRYLAADRWPDLLRRALAPRQVRIEGQNGRFFSGALCGAGGLADGQGVLRRHLALDMPGTLILQLGTNDLLAGLGVAVLADALYQTLAPLAETCQVIGILPRALDPLEGDLAFGPAWMVQACRALARDLQSRPLPAGMTWLEGEDAWIDPFDGIHLSAGGHHQLAARVLELVAHG
ncbi:GDSL-type esterase/lipase family protein [Peptococcus simiae]|uniref:GDSL-type esterase/lipase family protein n=1 Tax=Peptococcus simiae TaxID=1643805 RepID=A0ABW9GZU2_9FIRM